MKADGSNVVRLTNNPSEDLFPTWSPDNQVIFVSDRDGRFDLYGMDLVRGAMDDVTEMDGGPIASQRRLTDFGVSASSSISWYSVRDIAFASDRDGASRIYLRDITPERLTSSRGFDWSPTWSPR